jgi:hypothetical protein
VTAKASAKAKPVGRPRTPKDIADRQALVRIANLAADMLITLRTRGVYESERELKQFLAEDGASFSTNDVKPALDLLESTGGIGRVAAKQNVSRRGWLIVNGNGNGSVSVGTATQSSEDAVGPVAGPDAGPDAGPRCKS